MARLAGGHPSTTVRASARPSGLLRRANGLSCPGGAVMKALFLAENSASEFSLAELSGRDAWAPNELVDAGAAGFAPVTHPGPCWSGCVHRLRHQRGLAPSRQSTNRTRGRSGALTHATCFWQMCSSCQPRARPRGGGIRPGECGGPYAGSPSIRAEYCAQEGC